MILNCNHCKRKYATDSYDWTDKISAICDTCFANVVEIANNSIYPMGDTTLH